MQVLIVRHGNSTNNVFMHDVWGRRDRGELTPEEAEAIWLQGRVDDPPLTEEGLREANELGRFYAPVRSSELLRALTRDAGSPLAVVNCVQIFKKTGRRLLVMPSPFLRTCQTAWPLAQAMGPELCAVKVNMDVYENGGVYVIGHDANGKPIRDGPGKCLSAGDILAQFPGYDVSALPAEGPWYTSGFEDNEAAGARAERVATWLRSAALQHEVGSRIKALFGVAGVRAGADESGRGQTANAGGKFSVSIPFPNTATSLIEIDAARQNMTLQWLSRIDHLGTSESSVIEAFGKL